METMTDSTDAATRAHGVLALELAPGHATARPALPQAGAGALAALVGRDLAALVPEAGALDLVLAAMHFDPAEVLRPGWPLHRSLHALGTHAPAPAGEARIVAFGADARGAVPAPLRADPALHGGSLRVLPFVLGGDPERVAGVAATLEACLLDLGMARADTALCAQEGFGARIEHARYLTVHDLTAMVALQYRNQGLDVLWPLVETALLSPRSEAWLDAPPEPLVHYAGGEARIALLSPDAWRRRHDPGGIDDPDRLERVFALFEARQRQFASVLGAHGIDVTFVHCAKDPQAEL